MSQERYFLKNLTGTGADVSPEALKVARRNHKRLEVEEATFIQSNLFEEIKEEYDIIVSNPPYIRTNVIAELQDDEALIWEEEP